MTTQTVIHVNEETLSGYIQQAALSAGYEQGFGIEGCDLSKPTWWAAYCRQSLDQQSLNNRLPEYLLTLARMAKEQGIVVPREYVIYDHETGEHLERVGMSRLRFELAHKRKVLGILFADLRCLSREPAPQQVFERECELLGIRLLFGDAPSGMDVGSQFARSALTFSNKMTRLATHNNARAGNIGRILKGLVPALKAAYGYRYRREADIGQNGRILVRKAWWEIDSADEAGEILEKSPAWVVQQIYHWIGAESRTSFWVARELNRSGVKAPNGGKWRPSGVCALAHRRCYTGTNYYNSSAMVPNPARPLGDVTGEIKRTINRPKPEADWVKFSVPPLVSEPLWKRANDALTVRGRGRGKEGKSIQVLLRGRIFCPRCGKPMVVRRDGRNHGLYYHCLNRYKPWDTDACQFRRFVPALPWDDTIWDVVFAMLCDDQWLEEEMVREEGRDETVVRMIETNRRKIREAELKIARVRDGYEGGLYDREEATRRIRQYDSVITDAQRDIEQLTARLNSAGPSQEQLANLRSELRIIRKMNLDKAGFEEKRRLVDTFDIKVYPTEDLKTARIRCGLGPVDGGDQAQNGACGKVIFGPPEGTIDRTARSS